MRLHWWLGGIMLTGVAIMAGAFILPSLVVRTDCGPVPIEQMIVAENGSIALALDRFKLDMGHYPNDLMELIESPTADEEAIAKWHGPYIKNADGLKDAWARPLRYRYPGKLHVDGYDLWSIGPDGESGTDDDISN